MTGSLRKRRKYAIQEDITEKNYAQYVEISIPDDDEEGVPFVKDEIEIFWKNKDKPI